MIRIRIRIQNLIFTTFQKMNKFPEGFFARDFTIGDFALS